MWDGASAPSPFLENRTVATADSSPNLAPHRDGAYRSTTMTLVLRAFAWIVVTMTAVFLLNNYLIFWRGWPGFTNFMGQVGFFGSPPATPIANDGLILAWLQTLSFAICILGPIAAVILGRGRSLRQDAEVISAINAYLIRAAFWMVLLVGLADMIISFLRVEELLEPLVGAELTTSLGRSLFRGPYVHFPLIGLAFVIAAFTRTLGFTWLALLVVLAELQIVLARFIFSYEQAFMGDLVRFWYAALFLFASAYTLIEEGHVRVDVLYAGFRPKTKGLVNAVGSLLLGISLCVVILSMGLWNKASLINAPLLSLEVSQSGFGMYVKYLMAAFLAIFAVSMMNQFASYLLIGAADYRGDPGGRSHDAEIVA